MASDAGEKLRTGVGVCKDLSCQKSTCGEYSDMAPRLSGQTSFSGVVFFVSKSLSGIERQKKL